MSRVHPDIQHDTFARLLQCEIFVQYTDRCKGCAESQQDVQDEKHAIPVCLPLDNG